MTDIIQWARLDDLAPAIAALNPPEVCYMYLERVPDCWLTEDERHNGLRLEIFNPNEDFNVWERGRIFCETFELRWETLDSMFQAVYLGTPMDLPGFVPAEALDLRDKIPEEHCYLLWGTFVPEYQREAIDADVSKGHVAFVEFAVPRVLYYPVSPKAKRVRMRVREYIDPLSGRRCYYRFMRLEEM